MSVTETQKIDFITESEDSNELSLVLSDHLDWENELEHIYTLQEKVNSYISFIESGQVKEHYPTKGKPESLFVEIYFQYPPTKLAQEFLNYIDGTLKKISVGFKYRVVPHEEILKHTGKQ